MKTYANWIPQRDGDFDKFQKNFGGKVAANPAFYGLQQADVDRLNIASGTWNTMFATNTSIHKDGAKDGLMTVMRELTKVSEADPVVTDEAKKQAGMPVHDTQKTPVPVPTTRPVAEIDTRERLQHTLRIRDEGSKKRSKPFGVKECEVWLKIGDPVPADLDECKFTGSVSRFSYVVNFKGADAGRNANYLLRWVNTRGVTGPLSEVHSAVIPG